jgi:conjugative relaxase-like TrwC/TraI family protein
LAQRLDDHPVQDQAALHDLDRVLAQPAAGWSTQPETIDTVEAATMVGRLHSAWRAVELGFRIERGDGPSGRLRHWRIQGVPVEVCELFSERSDEIAEHLAATGQDSYRARGIAARASRSYKRHTGPDELIAGWHAELAVAGWPLERLSAYLALPLSGTLRQSQHHSR